MKKNKPKNKAPQKHAEECKAVSLPLNDKEQAILKQWRQGEAENQAPFMFHTKTTSQQAVTSVQTLSDRGSDIDKKNLVLAGLCAVTGAKSSNFASRLFRCCVDATGMLHNCKPKEDAAYHCYAVADALHALKPQDEFEGMLITRLIALHFQYMNYLSSSIDNDTSSEVREMHLNRATKLMRLYNETLETLMRYRRKGTQQVVVQHVHVEQGGQAIVGNVQAGGGESNKI
jgi:hypothetical protein